MYLAANHGGHDIEKLAQPECARHKTQCPFCLNVELRAPYSGVLGHLSNVRKAPFAEIGECPVLGV